MIRRPADRRRSRIARRSAAPMACASSSDCAAVELDVQVDEDPAARRPGLEVVVAVRRRASRRAISPMPAIMRGVGAAVHQRVRRRPCRSDAAPTASIAAAPSATTLSIWVSPKRAEAQSDDDGADVRQEVAEVVERVGAAPRGCRCARATRRCQTTSAEGQDDRDRHHDHAPALRQRSIVGVVGEQPGHGGPGDDAGRDRMKIDCAERREILGRGMAEGVVLVGAGARRRRWRPAPPSDTIRSSALSARLAATESAPVSPSAQSLSATSTKRHRDRGERRPEMFRRVGSSVRSSVARADCADPSRRRWPRRNGRQSRDFARRRRPRARPSRSSRAGRRR